MFLDFGVSFDSTLTLLFSITTPSSVSLLPIPFALNCRTLKVLSSLFYLKVVVVCHDQVRCQIIQSP